MGLLDSMFNKESKLLARASKELARVDSLTKEGKRNEALAELEKTLAMLKESMMFIEKKRPDFSKIFSSVGSKLVAFDRAQAAYDTAKVSLQLNPSNADAMAVAGRSALRLGNKDEALSWMKNAVGATPNSTEYWSLLGETQDTLGDVSSAIECYKRVLAIDPNSIRHYEKILVHAPKDTDMIKKKAQTLARLGRARRGGPDVRRGHRHRPQGQGDVDRTCRLAQRLWQERRSDPFAQRGASDRARGRLHPGQPRQDISQAGETRRGAQELREGRRHRPRQQGGLERARGRPGGAEHAGRCRGLLRPRPVHGPQRPGRPEQQEEDIHEGREVRAGHRGLRPHSRTEPEGPRGAPGQGKGAPRAHQVRGVPHIRRRFAPCRPQDQGCDEPQEGLPDEARASRRGRLLEQHHAGRRPLGPLGHARQGRRADDAREAPGRGQDLREGAQERPAEAPDTREPQGRAQDAAQGRRRHRCVRQDHLHRP